MEKAKDESAAIEANSRAFFKEAVAKCMLADVDPDQWRFAIISIVQSFELLLKARLANIHPAFVFESIDVPNKFVGIQKAIERVSSSHIGAHTFDGRDRKRLQTAISSRNEYTHGAGHYTPQHAQSVFFEVFALVTNFFKDVFDVNLIDLLSAKQYDFILQNINSRMQLRQRALQKIKSEQITDHYLRECCECLEITFVMQNGIDTCYTCQYSEILVECSCCGDASYFEHEFVDLTELFHPLLTRGYIKSIIDMRLIMTLSALNVLQVKRNVSVLHEIKSNGNTKRWPTG